MAPMKMLKVTPLKMHKKTPKKTPGNTTFKTPMKSPLSPEEISPKASMSQALTVFLPKSNTSVQVPKLIFSMASEVVRDLGDRETIVLRDVTEHQLHWLVRYLYNPNCNLPNYYSAQECFEVSSKLKINDCIQLSGMEVLKMWMANIIPEVYNQGLVLKDCELLSLCDKIFFFIIKEPFLRGIVSDHLSRKNVEYLMTEFCSKIGGYSETDSGILNNSMVSISDSWSQTNPHDCAPLSSSVKSSNSGASSMSSESGVSDVDTLCKTSIAELEGDMPILNVELKDVLHEGAAEDCCCYCGSNAFPSVDSGAESNMKKLCLDSQDEENLFLTIGAWALKETGKESTINYYKDYIAVPLENLHSIASLLVPQKMQELHHTSTDLFSLANRELKIISSKRNEFVKENPNSHSSTVTPLSLRSCLEEFIPMFNFGKFDFDNFCLCSSLYPMFANWERELIQFKIIGRSLLENHNLPNCYCIKQFILHNDFESLFSEDMELANHLKGSKCCRDEFQEKFSKFSSQMPKSSNSSLLLNQLIVVN